MDKSIANLIDHKREVETKFDGQNVMMKQMKDSLLLRIVDADSKIEAMSKHEERLNNIDRILDQYEKEIIKMKKEGAVDYSRLCSKDEYLKLVDRIDDILVVDTKQDELIA